MSVASVPVTDRFGRPVTHLRVSVTLRCNHSCIFCHREGVLPSNTARELSPEDIEFLVSVSRDVGIKYVKLTGGEPLVRDDIVRIVSLLRNYVEEVSLVSNGSLLSRYAAVLAEAGLDRVNVSLHSVREETFKQITGGRLSDVLSGIDAAVNAGLKVKLDFLLLRQNFSEFHEVIDYATRKGLDINVIELIPIGMSQKDYASLKAPMDPVIEYLESHAARKHVIKFQNRPVYELPAGIKVYVIRGHGNPELCAGCTRLRVTPDGKLKTCIYRNDNLVDAWEEIRSRNREGLLNKLLEAIRRREPFFKPRNAGLNSRR